MLIDGQQVQVPDEGATPYYKFTALPGATSVTISIHGGGEGDLYVRAGSRPTTSIYSCRPMLIGSNETCTLPVAKLSTFYAMVLPGRLGLKGIFLLATSNRAADSVTSLTNNQAVKVSGAQGSEQLWKIATPAGVTLTITISGGSGDADLYTRFGDPPTVTAYECRPYLIGNGETCTVTSTREGSYYVLLRGYVAYSGVSLKARY